MTDPEIEMALAALVGTRRKARELLGQTTLRHLAEASLSELEQFLPRGRSRQFSAALRLARAALSPPRPKSIETADDAFAHLFPYLAGREAERFVAVACDVRFQVLTTTIVSEGSPASVEVRPADVFAGALRHRAVSVVLGHNHPSNRTTPSDEDFFLTERLVEVGKLLGIHVIDHIIVAGTSYRSLIQGDRAAAADAKRGARWR